MALQDGCPLARTQSTQDLFGDAFGERCGEFLIDLIRGLGRVAGLKQLPGAASSLTRYDTAVD